MAIARETTASLEDKIGLTPFDASKFTENELLNQLEVRDAASVTLRQALHAWLEKQGIPSAGARAANNPSLAKAYVHKPYLKGWRSRVNPNWDLLGEGDDDDTTGAVVPQAAERPVGTLDEAGLRALFAQIESTTAKLIDAKLSGLKINLDDGAKAQIRALAQTTAEAALAAGLPPREINVRFAETGKVVAVGRQHMHFDKLLRAVQARNHKGYGLNIWLTGPTGSGKTSAAEAVATALAPTFSRYANDNGQWTITNEDGTPAALNGLSHDAPFGADSSLDADYKVIGFKDANGQFHWTTFLRIFVYGGVYAADEIDNWHPSALLALNAALANGWISTPIGMLRRHKQCIIIGCANTWGLGATSGYVGRNRLDDASLDRFRPKIEWPYDEKLELAVATDFGGDEGAKWCNWVQATRKKVLAQGLKLVVSPRSTFDGIANLQAGFDWRETTDMCLVSEASPEQKRAIGLDNIPGFTASGRQSTETEIRNFIRQGQLIDAIKAWREAYNSDLVTAKNAVEKLRDEMSASRSYTAGEAA